MVYSYVVTSQRSTSVNQSIICNFTSENEKNLVLARSNHLEVHTFREEGLLPELDVPLFGNILSMAIYRPVDLLRDVLFILTDKKTFCVLAYDPVNKKVITRAVGNAKDKIGREIEFGQRVLIDPNYRMIGIMMYEGLIKMVPIDSNGLREAFNLALDETSILDIAFLHGCPTKPTLCILYEDHRKARHVKTLSVDLREKELISGPWSHNNVEFAASMLIPVPSPLNGVILVGAMSITYLSGTGGSAQSVEIPLTQILTFSPINEDGTRYLLGDHRGNLFVLVLNVSAGNRVTSLVIDNLGITSISNTLNYLDNGIVFVGSAYGDSQLIKLHAPSSGLSDGFAVLDTYPNVGPIVDMCLVDNEKQGGQKQLVTCSGAYKDGSLKIIRSGIGIVEQASLEVDGIKGTWSLRSSEHSAFDKHLVQSFVGETRILSIEGEELGEAEFEGFDSQQSTLFSGNMTGSTLVQVTPSSVRLVHSISFALLDVYTASKSITVATGNLLQIAVVITGGELVCLEVDPETCKLVVVSSTVLDQDVACLSFQPAAQKSGEDGAMEVDTDDSDLTTEQRSNLLALGMWTDNSVRLLAVPTLEEVSRVHLDTDTQTRDILLVELDGKVFLLVGLGDGHLITYTVDFNGGLPSLANKRKGVLGTHAISFKCFRNAAELCVFASCDRPTVIYARNEKLLFSSINTNKMEISTMTPFHSELFPECLAMVSESSLLIGTIEDIQKIHIQSIPLGEAPRRIAHSASSGTYAVCTEKTSVSERGEESVSQVLFFEDADMQRIGSFELDRLEQGISLLSGAFVSSSDTATSTSSASAPASVDYLIVGTAQVINDELEPSRGRILVFEVTADRRVVLVAEKETKGAVFSLAMLQGKLAAGVSSRVQLYSLVVPDPAVAFSGPPQLKLECTHPGFVMSLFLKANGNKLLVGDMIRSMSLLQLNDGALKEGMLEDVARDFNSAQLLAVEFLEGSEHFLGCDDFGNLYAVQQQTSALSDEERCKLESFAEFNLGDHVNVFRRGTLVGQPIEESGLSVPLAADEGRTKRVFGGPGSIVDNNYHTVTGYPPLTDSVLFGTVGGAVGSVIPLTEDSFRFFSAIERAMTHVITPIGGLTHTEWRAFQNDMRGSAQRNMVDGDLVELFLDLSANDLDTVCRDVNEVLNNYLTQQVNNHTADKSVSSESTSALLHKLDTERIQLSVEDIVRRVEDIARLH